ncbi:hypothetical protein PaG_00625 [Moesziomyces aphidis]|uniref:Uncharacterized protein n=1 Tax=Moesziomyces aphidis TaxID=84754 RepID=W3VSS4_MOEAP|nr:hypothetical protein PaG_00625 [Moesziomyces aphidis]
MDAAPTLHGSRNACRTGLGPRVFMPAREAERDAAQSVSAPDLRRPPTCSLPQPKEAKIPHFRLFSSSFLTVEFGSDEIYLRSRSSLSSSEIWTSLRIWMLHWILETSVAFPRLYPSRFGASIHRPLGSRPRTRAAFIYAAWHNMMPNCTESHCTALTDVEMGHREKRFRMNEFRTNNGFAAWQGEIGVATVSGSSRTDLRPFCRPDVTSRHNPDLNPAGASPSSPRSDRPDNDLTGPAATHDRRQAEPMLPQNQMLGPRQLSENMADLQIELSTPAL